MVKNAYTINDLLKAGNKDYKKIDDILWSLSDEVIKNYYRSVALSLLDKWVSEGAWKDGSFPTAHKTHNCCICTNYNDADLNAVRNFVAVFLKIDNGVIHYEITFKREKDSVISIYEEYLREDRVTGERLIYDKNDYDRYKSLINK